MRSFSISLIQLGLTQLMENNRHLCRCSAARFLIFFIILVNNFFSEHMARMEVSNAKRSTGSGASITDLWCANHAAAAKATRRAGKIYNAMIDKRPAFIARCVDVADVIAAVNFGRENSCRRGARRRSQRRRFGHLR